MGVILVVLVIVVVLVAVLLLTVILVFICRRHLRSFLTYIRFFSHMEDEKGNKLHFFKKYFKMMFFFFVFFIQAIIGPYCYSFQSLFV